MTTRLLIGNAVSLCAAVFTVLSALAKGRRKIYGYQTLQCLIMAADSIVFMSASGVVTFLICALRNYLAAYDRFTKPVCFALTAALTVVGLLANNRGVLGILPIAATLIYTFGTLYVKGDRKIKLNAGLNLVLWTVYDIFILDYVSVGVDAVSAAVTFVSAFRSKKDEDVKSGQTEFSAPEAKG